MTSSNLQKELNYFVFNTMGEEGLIDLIKKEITIDKMNYSPLMLEERWQPHLSEKQLLRINAYRYAEGFKLAKRTSNPSKIFHSLDYTVATLGLTLNTNAFLVSIDLLGDQDQVKYWRQQVYQGKAIGGYGQTELGHGSNVRDLQTVAIYHQEKEKFIINSPANTSAKYWPGVLGQYATHAVIQAKTIVKGVNIGIQTFVVQIRNQKLQSLKNVEAFDIGPKLGFQKVDNGALFMRQVELPRNSMLMKYVKVGKDGKVQGLQNKQAIKYGYGSMLNLRVKLTYSFALGAIIQPTIAFHQILTRIGKASQEANRKRITEWLCCGYGIVISNKNTHNIFNQFLKEITNSNFQQADKLLINCHIISSTFKALSSRIGIDISTELLTFNSLAKFKSSFVPFYFTSYAPSTTYEGDNTVLLQQTAKYLLFKFDVNKNYENVNKTLKSSDWESISKAIQYIISEKLKIIKNHIQEYGQKGLGFKTTWNQKEQVKLIEVSILWGYMMFLKGLAIILPKITNNKSFYTKICAVFTSFVLSKITDIQIYGFTIEEVNAWKSFSQQELEAMININAPVERSFESMRFYERQGDWIRSSL